MNGVMTNRNLRDDPEMFDQSMGYDDETSVKVAEGLSPEDKRKAALLYRLFSDLWGLAVIQGAPGTGKDVFGNYLAYTIKRFFPWKRILRDERPRPLFGAYAGLFTPDSIKSDLDNMRKIAKGIDGMTYSDALGQAADDWVKGAGEVFLKNSFVLLTEYWKYVPSREPHKPINKTMGAIHKVGRHLDCFILGTVQLLTDLDKYTCKPFIKWIITCTRSKSNPTHFVYIVQPVKYNRDRDRFDFIGKAFPIPIDAGKPRKEIGDGKIRITKPKYQPENENERVVLEALKTGISDYDTLVDFLYEEGDMEEWEILQTLKELGLNMKYLGLKVKMAIDYPCYFKIFNSKSAVDIGSNVKLT